jgi:hypothetical protein
MAKSTRKVSKGKDVTPKPKWRPWLLCEAAKHGSGTWGREFDLKPGNRAEAKRAHVIAAFIEDLLTVDESDNEALLLLFDRHFISHKNGVVTEEMREAVRGGRWFLTNLYHGALDSTRWDWTRHGVKAMARFATKKRRPLDIAGKRARILRILEKARAGYYKLPLFHKLGMSPTVAKSPRESWPQDADGLTEAGRVCFELSDVDQGFWNLDEFVGEIVAKLQESRTPKKRPLTLPLAAAKLTVRANVFGDGHSCRKVSESERAARSKFDKVTNLDK